MTVPHPLAVAAGAARIGAARLQHAFGEATGHVLLIAPPYAVLSLLLLLFIEEKPMRQTVLRDHEIAAQQRVPTALASS